MKKTHTKREMRMDSWRAFSFSFDDAEAGFRLFSDSIKKPEEPF